MKVIIFGATGMVGQGVLREALNADDVSQVLAVGRAPLAINQSAMWARVKRRTEQDLLALPFKAAYMFRPGVIQPLHGVRSKTPAYNIFYTLTGPLLSLARRLLPRHVLSTEELGVAMLEVVRHGAPKAVLETGDIRELLTPGKRRP